MITALLASLLICKGTIYFIFYYITNLLYANLLINQIIPLSLCTTKKKKMLIR